MLEDRDRIVRDLHDPVIRQLRAASAEGQAATVKAALAGMRVADVMTPHPELAAGWLGVAEFTPDASRSRQDAFPVVGCDGELTGALSPMTRRARC